MKQTIRIIGGRYRGKKIQFPDLPDLRPTPDRVRETVFNWLMGEIQNTQCLDAFAGSGALGFEAFSRGASNVVLVERSAKAASHLKQQAKSFSSAQIQIVQDDCLHFLTNTTLSFDIIFLDPPFTGQEMKSCIQLIEEKNRLNSGGLLYLESPAEISLDANKWQKIKLKTSGQVTYGLYKSVVGL